MKTCTVLHLPCTVVEHRRDTERENRRKIQEEKTKHKVKKKNKSEVPQSDPLGNKNTDTRSFNFTYIHKN